MINIKEIINIILKEIILKGKKILKTERKKKRFISHGKIKIYIESLM